MCASVPNGSVPTVLKGDTGVEELALGAKARQHRRVAPTSERKKRGAETDGLVLLLLQSHELVHGAHVVSAGEKLQQDLQGSTSRFADDGAS